MSELSAACLRLARAEEDLLLSQEYEREHKGATPYEIGLYLELRMGSALPSGEAMRRALHNLVRSRLHELMHQAVEAAAAEYADAKQALEAELANGGHL